MPLFRLEVSISSSAFVGDIDVIGGRKSGIGNQIYSETENYEQSARRVKISISLFIGDVDVRLPNTARKIVKLTPRDKRTARH